MPRTHLDDLIAAAGGIRPLARRLGVHWTTVHRWLNGTPPAGATAALLASLTPAAVKRLPDPGAK